ncbi:hypothetical protein RRG08_012244, partial [Elysia crispata]
EDGYKPDPTVFGSHDSREDPLPGGESSLGTKPQPLSGISALDAGGGYHHAMPLFACSGVLVKNHVFREIVVAVRRSGFLTFDPTLDNNRVRFFSLLIQSSTTIGLRFSHFLIQLDNNRVRFSHFWIQLDNNRVSPGSIGSGFTASDPVRGSKGSVVTTSGSNLGVNMIRFYSLLILSGINRINAPLLFWLDGLSRPSASVCSTVVILHDGLGTGKKSARGFNLALRA